MRALKRRLEKAENARRTSAAEPIVIERTIVEPDGTEVDVIRRVLHLEGRTISRPKGYN